MGMKRIASIILIAVAMALGTTCGYSLANYQTATEQLPDLNPLVERTNEVLVRVTDLEQRINEQFPAVGSTPAHQE